MVIIPSKLQRVGVTSGYIAAVVLGILAGVSGRLPAQDPVPEPPPPIQYGRCYVETENGWVEVQLDYTYGPCQNPRDCVDNYRAGCHYRPWHALPECEACDYWQPFGDVARVGTCAGTSFQRNCEHCTGGGRLVCASGWEYRDAQCRDRCDCSKFWSFSNACLAERQEPTNR